MQTCWVVQGLGSTVCGLGQAQEATRDFHPLTAINNTYILELSSNPGFQRDRPDSGTAFVLLKHFSLSDFAHPNELA
jgi:hypothetical protein